MSWEQLRSMRAQVAQDQRTLNTEIGAPTVCPIDGALLNIRADGVRDCPVGNFTYGGTIQRHQS